MMHWLTQFSIFLASSLCRHKKNKTNDFEFRDHYYILMRYVSISCEHELRRLDDDDKENSLIGLN